MSLDLLSVPQLAATLVQLTVLLSVTQWEWQWVRPSGLPWG